MEEKERNLTLEYYDDVIDQWRSNTIKTQMTKLQNHLGRTRSITAKVYQKSQLESLVQRYPNDFGYRFELGVFIRRRRLRKLSRSLSISSKNAKVRLDAILYLGRAYSRKNFHDLAIEQFNLLKSEIQIMDERKKRSYLRTWMLF